MRSFVRELLSVAFAVTILTACGGEAAQEPAQTEDVPWGYRVSAYDVLAQPGDKARLRVKVEYAGPFHVDAYGVMVTFSVNGEVIGRVESGDEGYADLWVEVPGRADVVSFVGRVEDDAAVGRLVVRQEEESFFVADIDQTISDMPGIRAFVTSNDEIPAVEGSVSTLKRLSREHTIIYLTARDDYLMNKTRGWLEQKGFPAGPLYVHDWELGGETSGAFKQRKLANLKERFPNLVAGAGDKKSDAEAYAINGMRSYLFFDHQDGAQTVRSWREIFAYERENR